MLELSKAGLSVAETQDAVRSVLELSAAAGLSNAESAKIVANNLNVFNLEAKEAAGGYRPRCAPPSGLRTRCRTRHRDR